MFRIKSSGTSVAMMLMLLLTSAQAQDTATPTQTETKPARTSARVSAEPTMAELEEQSRVAYEAENYVRFYGANIKMMNQRPYEPLYMRRVTAGSALIGRMKTAYHYMMRLQQQGFSYDMNEDPDTANIRGTELYTYLNDLMIKAGDPAGTAETVATLSSDFNDPSATTWDESRDKILLGTRSSGSIIAVSNDGTTELLIQANDENGMWAIKGLHADVANNRLWVSSAAVAEFSAFHPTDKGRGALFEFNLKTLELVNRFNLPLDGELHELGPIAVTDAGDVYIVDHAAAVIFRKAAAGDKLEQFVGSTDMQTLTDIAVKPDNSVLYIADLYKGVLAVEPAKESSLMLAGSKDMNFGRINSISYDQGKLAIIQTGFRPERLMQLDLDVSGMNVTAMVPVASAQEEFDHPGLGVITGGYGYYLGNLGNPDEAAAKQARLLMRSTFPIDTVLPVPGK